MIVSMDLLKYHDCLVEIYLHKGCLGWLELRLELFNTFKIGHFDTNIFWSDIKHAKWILKLTKERPTKEYIEFLRNNIAVGKRYICVVNGGPQYMFKY